MRRFRKATIKDVAKHAGVSTTTVSYFVSGRDTVCSPETAERIRTAIAALQYTPSSLTGGLRQRFTTTLGVCTSHPFDADIVFATSYFERLIRGVMHQADIEKYALLRYHVNDRTSDNSDVFLDGRVDGLIFDPLHARHAPRMVQAGMPTVVVTLNQQLPSGTGGVYADEAMTVDLALSHLWALGHRRIAHIAGPVGAEPVATTADDIAISRLDAYTAWMKEHGVYDPALVALAGSWQWIVQPDSIARWRWLREPPTAVFCANDELAVHFIGLARQLHWKVPEDMSVVGVDNFDTALTAHPALTTVDVPVETIGREAIRIAVALIHGAPVEQCRVCVPVTRFVVRASTAPLSRGNNLS